MRPIKMFSGACGKGTFSFTVFYEDVSLAAAVAFTVPWSISAEDKINSWRRWNKEIRKMAS